MATIALAAAFSYGATGTAATVLGAIGSAVGAYLDNTFVIPTLLAGTQKPPTFGGQSILVAEEGAPVSLVWGGEEQSSGRTGLRVNAAVLWSSDPYSRSRGGSGKRGEVTQTTWYADVQLMFAGNYCAGIDRLLVEGEVIFETNTREVLNESCIKLKSDQAVSFVGPIELDYETFYVPDAVDVTTEWRLVLRSSKKVDGTPVDRAASDRLARIREGDDVDLELLDPAGIQTSVLQSTLRGPYPAVRVSRDPAGNTEVWLRLTPEFINPRGLFQTWGTARPPTSYYPVYPTVDSPVPLTITATRPTWKPSILETAVPIEGEDWEISQGVDEPTQSSIVQNATEGGLGDDAPFNPRALTMTIKGLNLSAFGQRIPNIQAVIREGAGVLPACVARELLHVAGVPFASSDIERNHFFFNVRVSAWTLSGSTPEPSPKVGAMQFRATLQAGPRFADNPILNGELFKIAGDSTNYRIVNHERVSTGPFAYGDTWIITVSPRLNANRYGANAEVFTRAVQNIPGFVLAGLQDIEAATTKLLTAFELDLLERGTTVTVRDATRRDVRAILPEHMDAREPDAARRAPMSLRAASTVDRPNRIKVVYQNAENNAQTGLEDDSADGLFDDRVRAGVIDRGGIVALDETPEETVTLTDMTLRTSQADALAIRLLRDARDSAQDVVIRLPSWDMRIEPNDELRPSQIPQGLLVEEQVQQLYGRPWVLVVDRVDIGANGIVELECFARSDDIDIAPIGTPSPLDAAINPNPGEGRPRLPRVVRPWVPQIASLALDLPPLTDQQGTQLGAYLVAQPMSNRSNLSTSSAYRGDEETKTNYLPIGQVPTNGKTGYVASGYLESASHQVVDRSSVLTVRVLPGIELVSVTEADMENGANFALVGRELVCFQTATLVGTETYELSVFRRGLSNTNAELGAHSASIQERFVFLGHFYKAEGFAFVPFSSADIGTDIDLRLVPPGSTIDDVGSEVIGTAKLLAGRPRPVTNLRWSRAPDDVVISWDRVPRKRFRTFGVGSPPLTESDEVYIVDIYDGETLARTFTTADGVRTVTYTLAQQTTDGLEESDTLIAEVRRRSLSTADSEAVRIIFNGGGAGGGPGYAEQVV